MPFPFRSLFNLVLSADGAYVAYFLFHALMAAISKEYFILWSCRFRKLKQGIYRFILQKRCYILVTEQNNCNGVTDKVTIYYYYLY